MPTRADVEKWTVAQVGKWLSDNGFTEYLQTFEENEVDGKALLTVTKTDLKDELDISKLADRKSLWDAIAGLQAFETVEKSLMDDTSHLILRRQYGRVDQNFDKMFQLLIERGCGECWHKSGNLIDHLVGVWRILVLWGQPEAMCRAGLFHSTYSTSYVALPIIDQRTERDMLKRLIGAEAEGIVFLLSSIDRQHLIFQRILALDELPPSMNLKNIRDGKEMLLSKQQLSQMIILTISDWCEQWYSWQDSMFGNRSGTMPFIHNEPVFWPGHLDPGLHLSVMSRLLRLAMGVAGMKPLPIFDHSTAILTCGEERRCRDAYVQACQLLCQVAEEPPGSPPRVQTPLSTPGHFTHVMPILKSATDANPYVAEPLVVLAQLQIMSGKFDEARISTRKALELLLGWGTSWDKRVPWGSWVSWCRVMLQQIDKKEWPKDGFGIINLGFVSKRV